MKAILKDTACILKSSLGFISFSYFSFTKVWNIKLAFESIENIISGVPQVQFAMTHTETHITNISRQTLILGQPLCSKQTQ